METCAFNSHFIELVDEIALRVVSLEPTDVMGMGIVLNQLDKLVDLCSNVEKPHLKRLIHEMRSTIEKIVLADHPSPGQGMHFVGQGVSHLQAVFKEPGDLAVCMQAIDQFLLANGIKELDASTGEAKDDKNHDESANFFSAPSPPPSAAASDWLGADGDKDLVESFVSEAKEHLSTIEVNVLNLEQDPGNLEVINAIFRPFHTIKGVSGFMNLTGVNRVAHSVESLLDDARNGTFPISEAITDLILDSVDLMNAMVEDVGRRIESPDAPPGQYDVESFLEGLNKVRDAACLAVAKDPPLLEPRSKGSAMGSLLVGRGMVTEMDVSSALEKQAKSGQKLGEILIEDGCVSAREVTSALREQKAVRGTTGGGETGSPTVRVDTKKLDSMVDMVGELVITQAILGQGIQKYVTANESLSRTFGQLGRITSELQRVATSLRMVPIRQTFQKMTRLVRDLSKNLGKSVDLQMVGEDTEIDRNMVDTLYDPLVHIIRNSIDHGIELPDARKAAGKPESGTIVLKAYYKGSNVIIEISDDGKGLDRKKIIEQGLQKGLIRSAEGLADHEIFSMILYAGFSTAEKVTDVSGRGVGMDVVKSAVDRIRGKLEVKSAVGSGTTILMKLPLTLAIIDGIIVRAGQRDFILPTTSVVESLRPDASAYSSVVNCGEMIRIRDSLYPLVRLHELFGFEPERKNPWEAIVVVVENENRRRCVMVDELLGKQEVVIKSLGEQLKQVRGMAGGAILSDGRVGLILDIAGLFDLHEA